MTETEIKSSISAMVSVAILIASVAMSFGIMQWRTSANAEGIKSNAEDIEGLRETDDAIQRTLIQRQGEIALDIQRIENGQSRLVDNVNSILRILREDRGETRSFSVPEGAK